MNNNTSKKRMRTVAAVLTALLIVALCALGARLLYLYFAPPAPSGQAPGNVIGSPVSEMNGATTGTVESEAVVLHKYNKEDNKSFSVKGMLPGDSVSQTYNVKVKHNRRVSLYFSAIVKEQSRALGDVLMLQVDRTDTKQTLFSGSFSELQNHYETVLSPNGDKSTVASYKITAFLPTETGNAYQNAALIADFKWFVTDGAALDIPDTGDLKQIYLWGGVLAITLAMIILLLPRKREEESSDA